jgi:hypothetical protein
VTADAVEVEVSVVSYDDSERLVRLRLHQLELDKDYVDLRPAEARSLAELLTGSADAASRWSWAVDALRRLAHRAPGRARTERAGGTGRR